MFDWAINFVENIFNHLIHFWVLDPWGVCIYYTPAVLCLIFYFGKSYMDVRKDLTRRDGAAIKKLSEHEVIRDFELNGINLYNPSVTYGTLLGRFFASVTPVVNIFVFLTQVLGEYFTFFFETLEKVFQKPLVSDTDYHQTVRTDMVNDLKTSGKIYRFQNANLPLTNEQIVQELAYCKAHDLRPVIYTEPLNDDEIHAI